MTDADSQKTTYPAEIECNCGGTLRYLDCLSYDFWQCADCAGYIKPDRGTVEVA